MAIAFMGNEGLRYFCHTQGPIDAVDWGIGAPPSVLLLVVRSEIRGQVWSRLLLVATPGG